MGGLLGTIIIGGLAGWIASIIMKASTGLIGNIGLGIVGAVVLNFILRQFDIYAADAWKSQLLVGLVGACLVIWVWRMIRNRG